jgi:hypothetical protein
MVGGLIGSSPSLASATTLMTAGPPATIPSSCKTVSYTADGGYFSMGQFYREPSYTVTLTVQWCYSERSITSYSSVYSTTIPGSLQPRISIDEMLIKRGTRLDIQLNGTFDSGIINNTGFIAVAGDVTRLGRHHFAKVSGAGG